MTRRVGDERRRITAAARTSWRTCRPWSRNRSRSRGCCSRARRWGAPTELAERFERESEELAELEVRSRMAGRWRMASVRSPSRRCRRWSTCSPGWRSPAATVITIGTLVAFTTLQTRLFFPIQSLLSVSVDVQQLAGPVRARLRVPRPAGRGRGAREARCLDRSHDARRRALRAGSASRYEADGPFDPRGHRPRGPGRDDPRARRRDRLRQDDARLSAGPPLRDERGPGRRSTASTSATSASPRSPRSVGLVSQETYLFHASIAREPALRQARGDATTRSRRRPARPRSTR